MTATEIKLGYMSIATGEWDGGDNDDSDYDSDCSSSDESQKKTLDPDEIIVKKQDITIIYTYPLSGEFSFNHHTDCPEGFTREELSVQIMDRYRKIYDEEENEDGDPGLVPGMLNRAQSDGPYGIWGHDIRDLILHTLYLHVDGTYSLGIDS